MRAALWGLCARDDWDSYRPDSGVATPVVVVGPTIDGDFSTADGALPYDDDFDPIIAGSDRDEVTAVAPDGADLRRATPTLLTA